MDKYQAATGELRAKTGGQGPVLWKEPTSKKRMYKALGQQEGIEPGHFTEGEIAEGKRRRESRDTSLAAYIMGDET